MHLIKQHKADVWNQKNWGLGIGLGIKLGIIPKTQSLKIFIPKPKNFLGKNVWYKVTRFCIKNTYMKNWQLVADIGT